ncbi:unnamed protein product [Adineta steineri]|uniref:Uncharacterized protein n=1 Tax=Adineta steineri TaxID=433720 RepID=A0A816E4Z5_9BILA|nr:unnamed protein product [Adineta steineri]CAF1647803.1 unnamed protein product [Adineta steineri]
MDYEGATLDLWLKQETQTSATKSLQEKLNKMTNILDEGTTRLATAMQNKRFGDIEIPEVLMTTAFKTKLIDNNENLNRLRKYTL